MRNLSATFFLAFALCIHIAENCGGTGKGGYRKLQPADAKDSTVGIKKFFNALDKDRNGYIEVGDLATRIVKSGMTPEEDNTENNIKSFDMNGDGKIGWNEFKGMIQYHSDNVKT